MRLKVHAVDYYKKTLVTVTKVFQTRGEVFGVYKMGNGLFRVIHLKTGRGVIPAKKLQREALETAKTALNSVPIEVFNKAISFHNVINTLPDSLQID